VCLCVQVDGVKNPLVQSICFEDMPLHKAAFASGGSQVHLLASLLTISVYFVHLFCHHYPPAAIISVTPISTIMPIRTIQHHLFDKNIHHPSGSLTSCHSAPALGHACHLSLNLLSSAVGDPTLSPNLSSPPAPRRPPPHPPGKRKK
jgi:hypothetical protein